MAVVKGPALSLEASGNLGAICFSRWRTLQVARDVWTGTYPNTVKQQAINASLTTVSQGWGGTLSAAEREAWVDAAAEQQWKDRLQCSYTPSGFQYYLKLNLRRAFMALGIMLMPPTKVTPVLATDLEMNYDDIGFEIEARMVGFVTDFYPNWVQYYKAGPYTSQARRPIEGEWRYLIAKAPDVWMEDSDIVLSKWYWIRARWFLNEGIVGNYFVRQIYAG